MWWSTRILLITTLITLSFLITSNEAFSERDVINGVSSNETVRFGKLIIGNGAQDKTSGDATQIRASTSGEVSDGTHEARFHLAEAKLKRLAPSVHCGDDAMTLRVPGARMPHFLLDRGEESPVPLSDMPARCGFSVKRVRRDVSLVAPYRGCHVRQQGGSYILPLLIMGAPVKMSCPVSPPLPTVSCFPSGMVISLGGRADTVNIKVDGSWQSLLLTYTKCGFTLETIDGSLVVTAPFTGSCWEIKDTERHLPMQYGDREVTLSCPLTTPTAAPTVPAAAPAAPDQTDYPYMPPMFYPFPYGRPWWGYPHGHSAQPVPTTQAPPTAPPTTTPAAVYEPVPQFPMFPQMYPMPMHGHHHYSPYYHYGMSGYPHNYGGYAVPPAPTAPPTTTTTTTAAQPAHLEQAMQYPMFPMFPHFHHMYGFPSPTTAPTTTTAAPVTVAQPELPPGYPQMYQMPPFYDPQGIKSFVPPGGGVQYPFMPYFRKDPVFGPRSHKSARRSRRQPVTRR